MSDEYPPPPPPSGPPPSGPPSSGPPPSGPPPSGPPAGRAPYEVYGARRKGNRVAVVLAVVVALVLVGVGIGLTALGGDDDPAPEVAADTQEGEVDLSDVQTFTTLRSDHVTETVDDYTSSPPAGGRHFPVWLECGVYDEPVRNEFLVHDLEHGAFWFAYDPAALDADEIDRLAEALPQNGVMTPYDGLDAPVVVSVWEAQLALTGVDDPRLPLFLEEYADGVTAPEPFASCAGGATLDDIDDLGLPTDLANG